MNILKLRVSFTLQEKDPFYRFYVQCPEVKDRPATGNTYMPADHLIEQGYHLVQLFQPDPLRQPDEVYAFFQKVS